MAFYLVDMGKDLLTVGAGIEAQLKKDGHHYIIYHTDLPSLLCVEELTEDQFLDHYKNTKTNG